MAHQCLACGHLFPEGSSAILQGCPECKGTRFFFTQEALPEAERQALAARAQKDLRQVVAELLKASAEGNSDLEQKVRSGQLRPADLRGLVKQAAETQARAEKNAVPLWENPDVQPYVVHAKVEAAKARVEAELKEAAKAPAQPDTVNILKPGKYEIDVGALLEGNPIVVHRDGAYHIHLASLFDAGKSRT
ncbi:MAG TPA: Zn-ribbon containing protein [Candidatus Thermoplasmatota archaeon]|nr:Zn-ribbon containing protein [Candidatus Thermoplasmatota archaeon]